MGKTPATADGPGSENERHAVARIHALAVKAGFIWHEITGTDIGIDAALECPGNKKTASGGDAISDSNTTPACGFLLLQIKGSENKFKNNHLTINISERNHNYWLAQRLPVVLCAVDINKDDKSKDGNVYFLDYQSLEITDYDFDPDPDEKQSKRYNFIIKDFKKLEKGVNKGFRFPQGSNYDALKKWLESVLKRQPQSIADRALETATHFLDVGLPKVAETICKNVPLWEDRTLDPEQQQELTKKIAKAYRRMAMPDEIEKLINKLESNKAKKAAKAKAKAKTEQDKFEFIMQYELALAKWTKAAYEFIKNKKSTSGKMTNAAEVYSETLWKASLGIIDKYIPKIISETDKDSNLRRLIWHTALVNIKSSRALIVKDTEKPSDDELHKLTEALDKWLSGESKDLCKIIKNGIIIGGTDTTNLKGAIDSWLSSKNEKDKDKAISQLLNSLRALCRGYLSKGEEGNAKNILDLLNEVLNKQKDPQLVSLIDLFLLQAWHAKMIKDPSSTAKALLDSTGKMLVTLHDPVLEAFHEGVTKAGEKPKNP